MGADQVEIESILEILSQTPGRIASVSMGHDNTRLTHRIDAESWSANEILAHLRACADVWGKSIGAMIKQDHPTLRYVSPRTYIRKTKYPALEFHLSLEGFTGQRFELLQILKALAVEDWSRGATITGTTNGRERSILQYAQRMARHEVEHCEQLEKWLESS
jgi:hypothetical protein